MQWDCLIMKRIIISPAKRVTARSVPSTTEWSGARNARAITGWIAPRSTQQIPFTWHWRRPLSPPLPGADLVTKGGHSQHSACMGMAATWVTGRGQCVAAWSTDFHPAIRMQSSIDLSYSNNNNNNNNLLLWTFIICTCISIGCQYDSSFCCPIDWAKHKRLKWTLFPWTLAVISVFDLLTGR